VISQKHSTLHIFYQHLWLSCTEWFTSYHY